MIFLIINFIINIFFACFEGKREAVFFYENINSSKPYTGNAHRLFVYLRSCFWALTFVLLFIVNNYVMQHSIGRSILYSTIGVFAEFLIFPFFHDGCYYLMRNKLDSNTYKKGFVDNSTTSTALIELSFKERLLMFIGGTIIYVICLCL